MVLMVEIIQPQPGLFPALLMCIGQDPYCALCLCSVHLYSIMQTQGLVSLLVESCTLTFDQKLLSSRMVLA